MYEVNLPIVRAMWRIAADHGMRAAIDGMADHFADHVEAKLRDCFVRSSDVEAEARSFAEEGDTVTVEGTLRPRSAGGASHACAVRWRYRFVDGCITAIDTEPLPALAA